MEEQGGIGVVKAVMADGQMGIWILMFRITATLASAFETGM